MTNPNASVLPSPSPEHRRMAAGMFERSNQVVASGNYDYGIRLLLDCCKLDPANLLYRQALRRTEKAKYRNNLRGSWFAWLLSWPVRLRLKKARQAGEHLAVLEHGERILTRNPWDVAVQMDLASAADSLGLLDLAIWNLEQARQKLARDPTLNRTLAGLYEKRGHFTQAMSLWQLVRKEAPDDVEANRKLEELAVHDSHAHGNHEEAPPSHVTDDSSVSRPNHPVGDPLARETAAIRSRLEADPTSPALYLQLARVYRRAHQPEQAHAVLVEGLQATANAFEVAIELADLEIEPFRSNLGITEEKLRANPDDGQLRKIRMQLRKEINSRELNIFRLKADRHPADLSFRYELGVRLMRAGQLDEAIRELQSARADARLRWQSLLTLGYCFKARSNWRLAQRNFEEALEYLPAAEVGNRKDILFELAQGHAEAGDLPRALDLGHELANLDFGYRGISQLLDEWQVRLQQAS